ncbi:hypothetical protein [Ostreiculturibacter nitratireducens]|uniref:hypothetical protein n=1 Tax=Ostreiculturibacter nitratireducens TaxID=3075226 RepID=UPI0031B5BD0A
MFPSRNPRAAASAPLSAALLLAAAFPAAAESQSPEPAIEAMKRAYLDCERAAMANALDDGGIMSCSVLYEELKAEGFDGSFKALRRWYDLQDIGREDTAV